MWTHYLKVVWAVEKKQSMVKLTAAQWLQTVEKQVSDNCNVTPRDILPPTTDVNE